MVCRSNMILYKLNLKVESFVKKQALLLLSSFTEGYCHCDAICSKSHTGTSAAMLDTVTTLPRKHSTGYYYKNMDAYITWMCL